MDRGEALARAASAPAGHLATVNPDGTPHVVVVTFALVGGNVVTAIDHKPKTTTRLRRLVNVEENGRASFLVDHYEDDWDKLWWVSIDGPASVHSGGEIHSTAVEALQGKYGQYRDHPPVGPVIVIAQETVNSWESTP